MERNRPARLAHDFRGRVQAASLLKRLNSFALADPDNPAPGDVRMTRTQVVVALALLRKVMPDLASVEVSGNPDRPLTVQVVRFSDTDEPSVLIDATPNAANGENGRLTPGLHRTAAPMHNGTLIDRLTAADPALSVDDMSDISRTHTD